MQFNRYIALPKSSLFYHRLFFIFRIFAFFGIIYFLWQSVITNQKVIVNLGMISINWRSESLLLLLTTILLLPVNWLLEALKWQIIAGKNNLSLAQSIKGVILGLTLDNVLPIGSGAISGRLLTIKNENKRTVIPGILVGQIAQSVITFFFGLFGLWMVWEKESAMFHWQLGHSLVVTGVILLLILAIVFWRQKIVDFLKPLKEYQTKDWMLVFFYSLVRYIIFLAQFVLLAKIFSPMLNTELVVGCATWVFAARTFMPKVSNLERLGIRALAVVFFMQLFSLPSAGILISVICLWFINLLIPSLVGLFMLKNLKFSSIFQ